MSNCSKPQGVRNWNNTVFEEKWLKFSKIREKYKLRVRTGKSKFKVNQVYTCHDQTGENPKIMKVSGKKQEEEGQNTRRKLLGKVKWIQNAKYLGKYKGLSISLLSCLKCT